MMIVNVYNYPSKCLENQLKTHKKKQLGPIVFFRIFLVITHEIDRFQPGISEVSMFISNDELGKPVNHRH